LDESLVPSFAQYAPFNEKGPGFPESTCAGREVILQEAEHVASAGAPAHTEELKELRVL